MDDHVLNGSEAASMNETTLSTGGGGADHLEGKKKLYVLKRSDTCSSFSNNINLDRCDQVCFENRVPRAADRIIIHLQM